MQSKERLNESASISREDYDWLLESWEAMIESEEEDPGSIDGPEDVMTSVGYVELWLDGDVVSHGNLILNLADDPDFDEEDDEYWEEP
jgi:hypothetical protein